MTRENALVAGLARRFPRRRRPVASRSRDGPPRQVAIGRETIVRELRKNPICSRHCQHDRGNHVKLLVAVGVGTLLIFCSVQLHRSIHGPRTGVTPLAAGLFVWILTIVLDIWNPLNFYPVSTKTWIVIMAAGAAFIVGYGAVTITREKRGRDDTGKDERTRETVRWTENELRPIKALWLIALIAGAVLFVEYATYLSRQYGLTNPRALFLERTQLGTQTVPIGFYFFYAAELVVPISVILAIGDRRHRLRYVVVALVAGASLVSTTGRTNATIAIIWALAVVSLIWGGRRLQLKKALVVVLGAAAILGLFVLVGDAIGKTYQNSGSLAAELGDKPPIPASFVEPYFYVAAPIPVFNQVISQVQPAIGGRHTFREVFQVLNAVDHNVELPPLNEPYRYIPYPSNVSTSITPLYEDFGMPGVVLGEFVMGALLASAYAAWVARRSPAALCVAAMAVLVAFTSSGSAIYNQPSWLLQALALCFILRRERRIHQRYDAAADLMSDGRAMAGTSRTARMNSPST